MASTTTSIQAFSANVTLFQPLQAPWDAKSPRLIILFSWYAAAEPHIAKYTAGHQSLFPTSTILLIRCPQSSVFFPSSWIASLRPAANLISQYLKDHGNDGNVLVQKFSNGGIGTFIVTLKLLQEKGVEFPQHTAIMDSCPGYFHWKRTHSALMASMPFWASPLIHLGIGLNWLMFRPWGWDNPMDTNAKILNSAYVRSLERRRLYVYGTGDGMVDWRDVEWHGQEARVGRADGEDMGRRVKLVGMEKGREKGQELEVRMEKFEGGRHVAQVRVDGERYWRVVRQSWEDE